MTRVAGAAESAGRDPSTITVVAVSKAKSVDEILAVYDLGHRDFGENRAGEMSEKASRLPSDIRWHFVGSLQSNKARLVRPITFLLHSMDRSSLAQSWLKGVGLPPPTLVQVDLGYEAQKSGVRPERAMETVERISGMGIDVVGLMAIPPAPSTPEDSRPYFSMLRQLRDEIAARHLQVSDLSMGMTDDFEVAITEGASIIRIGRAIFGARS